jgi:hypothetical protein
MSKLLAVTPQCSMLAVTPRRSNAPAAIVPQRRNDQNDLTPTVEIVRFTPTVEMKGFTPTVETDPTKGIVQQVPTKGICSLKHESQLRLCR